MINVRVTLWIKYGSLRLEMNDLHVRILFNFILHQISNMYESGIDFAISVHPAYLCKLPDATFLLHGFVEKTTVDCIHNS